MNTGNIGIVIHGGAGTILKSRIGEKESDYAQCLVQAREKGFKVLQAGGSAIDAVEAAVNVMEDEPLFNAGKGSVFAGNGRQEMDAAIMDGRDNQAGGVTGITRIANPISLARKVMTSSNFVLLSGEGAEEFAMKMGFEFKEADYFFSQERYDQYLSLKDKEETELDFAKLTVEERKALEDKGDFKFGTVGAVALDMNGDLAAATSTGGMANKRFGRIGDSPIIGAGVYANNETCAISSTGFGEFFLRGVTAYDISAIMEYRGKGLQEAAEVVIHEKLKAAGGEGGVIGIDGQGNMALPFNTAGMFRAWKGKDGEGVEMYGGS